MAMAICREHLDMSLAQVAEAFGKGDHGTVINALKNSEELLKKPFHASCKQHICKQLANALQPTESF